MKLGVFPERLVAFTGEEATRRGQKVILPQEIRMAVTSVWVIVSAILLSALLASCLLPDRVLISLSTACQLQHNQQPCALCGMTRAFMAISQGRLDQATTFNRWSVALYGSFLVNGLLAAIFLVGRIRNPFLSFRATSLVTEKTSTKRESESCRY